MGVVGIDVGGTFVKGGVLTARGALVRRRVASRSDVGPSAVLETILSTVDDLLSTAVRRGCEVEAVGLATLGIVDEAQGTAVRSTSVGWQDVPLAALVAERVDVPVVLAHDVRVAAVAEATMGAGQGHRNVLFLALGTGLAAAQVIEGQALAGATWRAGEVGQLRADGSSGRQATLEGTCSARGLAERYARAAGLAAGNVDAAVVIEAARRGDALAEQVLNEALHSLAETLAVLISFADPSVVIIGGGLSLAGNDLMRPLRSGLAAMLGWREAPPLVAARFGAEAGWVGAGLLAWRRAGHPDDRFPLLTEAGFAPDETTPPTPLR